MFSAFKEEDRNYIRQEASAVFQQAGIKPRIFEKRNLSTFGLELKTTFHLIREEKEILLFAILQWAVMILGYMVWTQILDWIPDTIWQEIRKANDDDRDASFTMLNLVFIGWGFLVIAVASYPLSILNAAMTAAQYLRSSDQTSTISKCLTMASRNLGRLWVFTAMDAWITVRAILGRLPKKRNRWSAADEALYYAWKIGTIGIGPALVAGKNYKEAISDSIILLKKEPLYAIGVRMGYSMICWIIGITTYIGAVYYFCTYGQHDEDNMVYNAYTLLAFPIFISVGVTLVLIRPFYLIMVASMYSYTLPLDKKVTDFSEPPENSAGLAVFFLILLGILLAAYFYGDQLGIRGWIESLAARDLFHYQQYLQGTAQ
ncbi:MAG TPA: hypothetical protein VGF14_02030 [Alphaproteobacteria bacterium]